MRVLLVGCIVMVLSTVVTAATVPDWSCTTESDGEIRITYNPVSGPEFKYSLDDLSKSFVLKEDDKTDVTYSESNEYRYYRFSYMSKELVEMSWVVYTGKLPDVGDYQGVLIFAGDSQIMGDECAVKVDIPLLRDIYVRLDNGSTRYDYETTSN